MASISQSITEIVYFSDTESEISPLSLDHPITDEEDEDFISDTDQNSSGWSDIDLIEQNQQYIPIQTEYNHSKAPTPNCWICYECNTTNNIQISRRKYNSKCCKCQNSYFIEFQTETIYSNQYFIPTKSSHSTSNSTLSVTKPFKNLQSQAQAQAQSKWNRLIDNYLICGFIGYLSKFAGKDIINLIIKYYKSPEPMHLSPRYNYYTGTVCNEILSKVEVEYPQIKEWKFVVNMGNYNTARARIKFGVIREADREEVDNRYYNYYTFCRKLKDGDKIFVQLDLEKGVLLFRINKDDYEYGGKVPLSGIYGFYANINQNGVSLEAYL